MINAIILLDACIIFGAIPCFILYKIGFKRGQKYMFDRLVRIAEKAKKEKGLDHD